MKEFKLSKKKEDALFERANSILDKRRYNLERKANKWESFIQIFNWDKFNLELKLAPLLIPATAAIIILLQSGESIEYDSNFIKQGTTIIENTDIQGE